MFKQLIYLISFLSLVAVLPAGATETERINVNSITSFMRA